MALKDFPQRVVHHPVDIRGRPAPFQAGQDGQCLDDIAQRAWFDDEDFHLIKAVILSLSKDL